VSDWPGVIPSIEEMLVRLAESRHRLVAIQAKGASALPSTERAWGPFWSIGESVRMIETALDWFEEGVVEDNHSSPKLRLVVSRRTGAPTGAQAC
jgi:hypothetical protein